MDEGDGPVVFPPFRTTVHFLDLPAISHHKSSRQNNGMSSRHYFATQQVPILPTIFRVGALSALAARRRHGISVGILANILSIL
jgi:hypothetical protein